MLNSRSIDDLSPNGRAWFVRFATAVGQKLDLYRGIDWEVCCTRRDREYQNKLYEQGRTTPGKIVTYTRDSRHLDGEAWDFFILDHGKAVWDSPLYEKIAKVASDIGLMAGYFWKHSDPGHIETPKIMG